MTSPGPTEQRSNPFVGLRPFEPDEEHLFFGRERHTEELLRRLRRRRFLAVVGTSGSGKSSLVRAGLLPSLVGGMMSGVGSRWRIAILRPGNDPIGNLARALTRPDVLGDAASDEAALSVQATIAETTLRRSALGLVEMARLARLPAGESLLVLVDQFEEIFRFKRTAVGPHGAEDSAILVKLLLEAGRAPDLPVYVLLTMRSDFLGDCAQFRDLPEAINDGQFLIPRLNRSERQKTITGPVAVAEAKVSARLVQRLLNDVGDDPDQLPVLQHALMRTWDVWRGAEDQGDALDIDAYDRIGRMATALSQHADEVYAELGDDPLRQAVAKVLFKALTDTTTDRRGVRRPVRLAEVAEIAGADETQVIDVVDRFRQPGRSFVMPPSSTPVSGETVLDISHESLMRVWDRLKGWAEEETKSAEEYLVLARDAARHEGGTTGLLREPALGLAVKWRVDNQPTEAWARRYDPAFHRTMQYLEASVEAHEAEVAEEERRRRRELRRTRLVAGVVSVFLVAAIAAGLYARHQKAQAEDNWNRVVEQQDALLVRLADDWMEKNPTTAALALLELHTPEAPPAVAAMRAALERGLLYSELAGHGELVRNAVFNQSGTQVLSASRDATARLWKVDGSVFPDGQPYILLEGHEGEVVSASFDPAGTRIVTASADGTARVWAFDGSEEASLKHDGLVWSASFDPAGTRIVTASEDETARLWNADGAGKPVILGGHRGPVWTATFDSSGTRIVTASADGTARVWRTDGSGVEVLRGHRASVRSAVFDAAGTRVVTASDDNTARIWDVDSPGSFVVLEGHQDVVWSAAFDPEGTHVVTASWDGTARVWSTDGSGDPVVLRGHEDRVWSAVFDRTGTRVVTASWDGTVRVWSADRSGSPVVLRVDSRQESDGDQGGVLSAAFSSEGDKIVTASWEGTVRVWTVGGEPVLLRGHEAAVESVTLDSAGSRIVTSSRDGTARVWNMENPARSTVLAGHRGRVWSAGFDSPGTRVVTASADGRARVWDIEHLDEPVVLEGHEAEVWDARFSPSGTQVVTASVDGTARVWVTDGTGKPLVLSGHDDAVTSAIFTLDGSRVITSSNDGTARVWSSDGSGEPLVLSNHRGAVLSASLDPTGSYLVTTSDDMTAVVWNLGQPRALPAVLKGHSAPVTRAGFDAGGTHVVTASDDHTARVWRTDGSERPIVLAGHRDAVTSASFNPAGTQVVTASRDNTARVWTLGAPDDPVVLAGHRGAVRSAVWSRDGTRVITASDDGTVRVWRVSGVELQDAIREATTRCLDARVRELVLYESPVESQARFAACELEHERCAPLGQMERPDPEVARRLEGLLSERARQTDQRCREIPPPAPR